MDRTRAWVADTALEAAKICTLLDNGLPQFLAQSMPGAGIGAGVRDLAGIDPDVGGGSECNE